MPFLRDLTSRHGTILVVDEIVTGFRLALGGAQEYFRTVPDMAVVGKGMANGMPLSAYVGRADLMESAPSLGISSTFGGETLSLAAARATLRFYREKGVIGRLWKTGGDLWPRVQAIFDAKGIPMRIRGLPVCPSLGFDSRERRDAFFRAGYRNGLSLYDVSYVNWSHGETDVAETLERFRRVAAEL
jgi:glutamate-1-semialdehyde 2,1-aminomutase